MDKKQRRKKKGIGPRILAFMLCCVCLCGQILPTAAQTETELSDTAAKEVTGELIQADTGITPDTEPVRDIEPETTIETQSLTETAPEEQTDEISASNTEAVSTETVSSEQVSTEAVGSETVSTEAGNMEESQGGQTEEGSGTKKRVTEDESEPQTPGEADGEENSSEKDAEKQSESDKQEKKPEFVYCTTVDGVTVSIYAKEGILPEGTTVTVSLLDAAVLENAVRSINDRLKEKEVVQIIGFDISFLDPDGQELHSLAEKVSIEYSGMDIPEEADGAQVYHADEEGNITHTLTENTVPAETVEFASDCFSPVLYAAYSDEKTETYEVAVSAAAARNEGAQVYYLKSPTSNPDSNDTGEWGNVVQYNGKNATVNMTGASWTDGKNVFASDANLNQYIISWPDSSRQSTWTLDKETYPEVYRAVYDTYKNQLEKDIGVTDLQPSDIEEITLVPHKISKNNGTYPDKHIDCTINVKCSKAYTAKFYVQNPGEEGYTNVHNATYKIVNNTPERVKRYTGVEPTKVVDGVTYVFDGWYREDQTTKIADNEWDYNPADADLADGTVNFYAKYVPSTTDITIEKQVTGGLGDVTKFFHFTYSYGDKTGNFELKDDETYTIQGVPAGTELILTETNASGYTTSAVYGSENKKAVNAEVTFTINGKDKKITVTNNKEGYPDTGVLLDSLPYVLILVIVAIGSVLFFKKRKSRYDD